MSNKLLQKICLAVMLVPAPVVLAQPAMTRTSFTATYTPIATATGATASTASGDNTFQDLIPIGFTFNYLGTNYTSIGVNTNGVAAFTGITASSTNTDLYTATAPNTILAPWWDDLHVASGTGSILYQTQGAPGSRTFTIQWTDVQSYSVSATALLNFQIVLYETSNMIEFRYGAEPGGTFNLGAESACIGLKSASGGSGQFIDAVTGSSFTGNAMLNAGSMWPSRNFRFAPGAPTPIAAGSYSVGLAGNYPNLSEAIAALNHRGVSSGNVIFTLIDSLNDATPAHGDNFFPMLIGPVAGTSTAASVLIHSTSMNTVTSAGAQAGVCITPGSMAAFDNTSEPVIAVVGGAHVGLRKLNIFASSPNVDKGLAVINASASMGSQYCGFQQLCVSLDRSNTNTIAIDQRQVNTPSGAAGANSYNVYEDISITNSYSGIWLGGNAVYPGMSNTIGSSADSIYSLIGGTGANDIGNGAAQSYGIRLTNQQDFAVYNSIVRNVSTNGAATCDGILIEGAKGISSAYNNKVFNIRNNSSAASNGVSGIRAEVAANGTQQLRIYNNFVYGISSAYAGPNSAVRQIRGIYVQYSGGGMAASNIHVDFNSVLLNPSATNISNACFEIGTVNGPLMNVRNNIFANMSGAQTSPAAHYCWVSPAVATGSAGSVSNYNDLYLSNPAQGFLGRGNSTDYPTLTAWQGAMTQDANSITIDPLFTSMTDLHAHAVGLNATALSLPWVVTDIDGDIREATPDMGADEFVVPDLGVISLVTPVAGNCYSAAEPVMVRVRNHGTTTVDFTSTPTLITVEVTGAVTQTMTIMLNTNAYNGNTPLAPGGAIDVPVGTLAMTVDGIYTFDAYTSLAGDGLPANDAMPTVNINFSAGTASASSNNICAGSTVTVTITGNTTMSIQWQSSTDGGNTWVNEPSTSLSHFPSPVDTTMYRVLMCGLGSAPVTVIVNETPPVAGFSYTTNSTTVTLTDTSYAASSYAWDFGDGNNSTQQHPVHTYANPGLYTVTLIATNVCGSDTTVQMINVISIGIQAAAAETGLHVYPNPAKDQVTLSFGAAEGRVQAALYDALGQQVFEKNLGSMQAGSRFDLNISDYKSGAYFLRVSSDAGVRTIRLLVRE